jgi:hypothetical protein
VPRVERAQLDRGDDFYYGAVRLWHVAQGKNRERDHGGTGQPRAVEQEEVGYGERMKNRRGQESETRRPEAGER